jgi:cytoskeletal protein RodZ
MLKHLNKRRRKGQSTLEYAVLVIIIIGALLSIQVYIKRGVQGRLKSAADDIGDQFSPGNTNETRTIKTSSKTNDLFQAGVSTSTIVGEEVTNETVDMDIINVEQEYWGE